MDGDISQPGRSGQSILCRHHRYFLVNQNGCWYPGRPWSLHQDQHSAPVPKQGSVSPGLIFSCTDVSPSWSLPSPIKSKPKTPSLTTKGPQQRPRKERHAWSEPSTDSGLNGSSEDRAPTQRSGCLHCNFPSSQAPARRSPILCCVCKGV